MKKTIVDKAFNIIQNKRMKALHEYEEIMKPLYETQHYKEFEKKYTKISIENARKEAYGQSPDTEQQKALKKILDDMKEQKHLKDAQPNFSCKICKDQAYVDGQMCNCFKTEISKILFKQSGFAKLESFDEAAKTCGDLAPVYALMKKWCNSDFKKNLVYIAGPTGVGKTYLIRCMANEFINRGRITKLITSPELLLDFRDYAKTGENEIISDYLSSEILFIDDLGTEPMYKNMLEYYYMVINTRKARKLPTIITSNLTMEDVRDRYDERIFSRIADRETSITLFIEGEDKRIKK